jgi:hypothetical protein
MTINLNEKALNDEDNLLIQSACSAVLILELAKSDNFVKSDFFRQENFRYPECMNIFGSLGETNKIQVGNQGSLLMVLYALLALPKEKLFTNLAQEFEDINIYIEKEKIDSSSAYQSDIDRKKQGKKWDYVRHIRNAVSHGCVEFPGNNEIIFRDMNKKIKLKCFTSS